MTTAPNIVYMHSHDSGRYVQPYGYGIATPRIQQLAEEGVLFRQAFCASPTCSPSRAALLTGMAPHNNGMLGLAHLGFSLNDYRQHIVHTLRRAGYFSALAGMQHIDHPADPGSRPAVRIGYDTILTTQARSAAQHAAAFFRSAPQQPFFLSVGFEDTHREYPEPTVNPAYVRPPAPIPDLPETRRDMAGYITSAQRLDLQIGQVLDALQETGLAENTLVICTTDHGLAFPGMKCTLSDHGTGVMLIMRGPGGFTGGQVIDTLISQLDLYPTLCDMAGAAHPEWLQGRSLLPLIHKEVDHLHDAVFSEVTFHVSYEPLRAIRTPRWKYIRCFDARLSPVLPNCDDSPAKSLWMQHGWREQPQPAEQLYDLMFDPNEAHNLADNPTYALVVAELAQQLQNWMQSTRDPLLDGAIPAPSGIRYVSSDGISPSELNLSRPQA